MNIEINRDEGPELPPGNRFGRIITLKTSSRLWADFRHAIFPKLTNRPHRRKKGYVETVVEDPEAISLFPQAGWAPRHILDYNVKRNAVKCRHCSKKKQFLVDISNVLTERRALICGNCCVQEVSPSSGVLLKYLDYLSNEGLLGVLESKREAELEGELEEYVFTLQPTAHLLRLTDVFRWFFTLSPFEASGEVVRVTVLPLQTNPYPVRVGQRYQMQLVAGSWAPEFHSGVTLFAKNFTRKPLKVKWTPPKKTKKKEKKEKKG